MRLSVVCVVIACCGGPCDRGPELYASTTPMVLGEVRAGDAFEGSLEVHGEDRRSDGPAWLDVQGRGEPTLTAGGGAIASLPATVALRSDPLRAPGVHRWDVGQDILCFGFRGFATVTVFVEAPEVEVQPYVVDLGTVPAEGAAPARFHVSATDGGRLAFDDVVDEAGSSVLAQPPTTVGELDVPAGEARTLDVLIVPPSLPGPFIGQLSVIVHDAYGDVVLAHLPYVGEVEAAEDTAQDSDDGAP